MSRVKWGASFTDTFNVTNGVRQGAVLSPILFNLYTECLSEILEQSGQGCYIGQHFYGIVVYADDIFLLAPSVSSLQSMLDICNSFSKEHGLAFNAKKSMCIKFHQGYHTESVLDRFKVLLGNEKLSWAEHVKHLGHSFSCCLEFDQDIAARRGQFIGTVNNIVTDFGFAHPTCKIDMLQKYGCSFYGAQLWDLYGSFFNKLCTTWNIALRKLYNLPYRCHTRFLKHITGLMHISFTLKRRFLKFFTNAQNSENTKVCFLTKVCKTNLSPTGLNLSRICCEFGISSTLNITFSKISSKLDANYQLISSLDDVEMCTCICIRELIDCIYNFSECVLTRNEIVYMIADIACN